MLAALTRLTTAGVVALCKQTDSNVHKASLWTPYATPPVRGHCLWCSLYGTAGTTWWQCQHPAPAWLTS
jgi:hypothetical protein